jgi:hypothetical protein
MDKRYQIPKLPPQREAGADRDQAVKEWLWLELFWTVCKTVFSVIECL